MNEAIVHRLDLGSTIMGLDTGKIMYNNSMNSKKNKPIMDLQKIIGRTIY